MILSVTFSLFNCFEMDDGKSYLRRDFEIECWTPSHARMALSIAIPIIIVWVFAFPAFVFIRLYNNRSKLNDKELLINYGLFYVGLNDKAYFWEVVVSNVRKIIFISFSTFLTFGQTQLKVIINLMIVI